MTDAEIGHELVTMVIAGHETVAGALTWTLMLLAEHPAAQDRVRAELAGHGGAVSMLDHRDRLPWTRAVVDEALRLYPPAWALSRRTAQPDVIAGVEVPTGTLVIISPWVVHRRPSPGPTRRPSAPSASWTRVPAGRPTSRSAWGRGCASAASSRSARWSSSSAGCSATSASTCRRAGSGPPPQAQVAVHPRGGMPLVLSRTGGDRHG